MLSIAEVWNEGKASTFEQIYSILFFVVYSIIIERAFATSCHRIHWFIHSCVFIPLFFILPFLCICSLQLQCHCVHWKFSWLILEFNKKTAFPSIYHRYRFLCLLYCYIMRREKSIYYIKLRAKCEVNEIGWFFCFDSGEPKEDSIVNESNFKLSNYTWTHQIYKNSIRAFCIW